MTMRTMFWAGAAASVGPPLICIATPRTAPAWIRYTEDGVMLLWGIPASLFILCLLVALFTPSRVLDRIAERIAERFEHRRKSAVVRAVPSSNSIQVLDGFLSDDLKAFDRQYSIVRKIHGDDIASRLTREQIEAEYDRYDRAETAASEDRCQHCDPSRVPADLLVEAWDERPGRERHLGEWLLCVSHAETKISSLRRTGATVVSEPMTAGYVDELTADHYGQGGAR